MNDSEQHPNWEFFHKLGGPLAATRWLLNEVLNGKHGPLSDNHRKYLESAMEKNAEALDMVHQEVTKDNKARE